MKTIWALGLLAIAGFTWAADAPAAAGNTVKGVVQEVKEVESYTYLRLKTESGETWAAVGKAPVKVGDKVSIEDANVMKNFESKSLKKTFPSIVFGSLAGSGAAAGGASMLSAHGATAKPQDATPDVKVPKATGPNSRTVADIVGKASELKDKPVLLRARVVKYSGGIMGKNWLHVRDGSGSEGSNDLVVTSTMAAAVGDVLTIKGVVRTDKDLGAGYVYKVLVEDATLQK